jgi:Flp pilus assembly pilin Flp
MESYVTSCLGKIVRLMGDEEGASATEYALLVTLIALVIMAGVLAFGNKLSGLYTTNTAAVFNALP